MSKPMVYLIGAGPGDPGLVSARGLHCLSTADVVLYDHQVHSRLLRHARPDAEQIDVGPAAPQPMEQEAICYLLAEKAHEGNTVARLKWGDPFVFDRGGEEALFLHEHGVEFEVVPGVPAAVAVPAYAGIPITYPGGGDTVTFVRGYEDEGHRRPQVDWASLARLGGTVVCYVGARQLAGILEAMAAHHWAASSPAALVFNGTLPSQETIQGTLAEVTELVRRRTLRDPAILVVGRVAALREHLRWFDARPLFGKRIVVTRPREQATDLIERLEGLGATVIEAPMIHIAAPDDYGPLDRACAEAGTFDWIVFASANGVDYFVRRLQAGPGDLRDLKGVRLCAIGPGTGERLARHGIRVDLMPSECRVEALVAALGAAGSLEGARVLLPRADVARDVLADELRRSGADVTEVTAYRTLLADIESHDGPDIYRMLLDKQVDVVTFTSASTVKAFVQLYGAEPAADLLNSTVVAAVGPVTAEAAEQYNIHSTIVPQEYTIPGLVHAIVDYFAARRNGSS
jgi:uroporphyrinogen III methyltransferase / synthase